MATVSGANLWGVSMQSGRAGAMACRPSPSCALLHRAPPGLSLVASPSARFISILSSPGSRTPLNVLAIHAQDPDFYKIPYVEGIPVGKRLKLWNLPPNCKHNELLEWFAGIDVKVESLEFTDDPVLNAQGIGGFVEFATKQQACIAIVRLDGYKFRGHYIRMDFAEKRAHSRDYGSKRNRPNRSSSSSRGSFATSSRPPVTAIVPSYGSATSANAQLTPRYEAANANVVQASSSYGSSTQSANVQSTSRHEAANSSAIQSSSDYGSSAQTSDFYRDSADNNEGIQSNPSYGNAQSSQSYGSTSPPAGYGTTQFPAGHGSAPSSSASGGTLSTSSATPPPNTQSAPSYGITPENDDASNKTTEYYPLPSTPAYCSTQSAPSYGNTAVFSSTQPSSIQHIPSYGNNHSSHGSLQRALSYDGTEFNGQSTTVPATPSYDSRSRAPPYGNSSAQPLYSDGSVTGKSFKSGSGIDKFPTSSYNSQLPTSSYSSQPSSSTSVLNNQFDSAVGKSIPWSYANSSPELASSMGKSTIQSGSSYGSIKDTAYGNSISPSYGDSSPPPAPHSSPSYGSVDSASSYGNTGMQSSTISTQSSFGSSQITSDSPSTKSSPGSVSIPPEQSYGEAQPSARSFTTQAAPSAFDVSKKSPVGALSTNVGASSHSAVAQGRPPSSPNTSYGLVEPYEDLFKNYGAPDAAVVEPWSANTSFRSGPMFGSPQPSSLHRLFVGNLALSIDDAALQELFSKFGTVLEARVLRDQESGRSRGFAVVAMSSVDEVKAASKALDGWQVESRPLKVDAVTSKH